MRQQAQKDPSSKTLGSWENHPSEIETTQVFRMGYVLIYLTEPVHSNRLAGREGRDSLYHILLLQNERKQFPYPKFDLHISFSIYLEDIFYIELFK